MFPVLIFLGLIQPEQPAYFLPKNWTKTQPVLVGWSLSSLSYPVGHESHNKLWNFGTFYQKTYVNHLFSYTMAPITNCSLTGGCTADFSELKSSGWGSLMFRMLCHSLVSNPVLSVKLWRKLVGKMAISFVVPRPSNSWTYSIIYIIYIYNSVLLRQLTTFSAGTARSLCFTIQGMAESWAGCTLGALEAGGSYLVTWLSTLSRKWWTTGLLVPSGNLT